ncbi:MAG: Rieske (2Fe-2S) protein [Acidimicrobiaceae bacterium]|nr:Rieske (2Fe-2S) protein [Acidimicrobiaceae bacterium]
MAEWPVGSVEELQAADRKIVPVGDSEVGVFRVDGRFYAYENRCRHQGGPVCEGLIIGKVVAVLEEDRNVVSEQFSDDETHLVCPWHGYEYDITTGECAVDRTFGLRRYQVTEHDGWLYVVD